jgi:hypothetical protein
VLDIAASIDQHADLAANLRRQFGHRASEFVRDEVVRLEASTPESFEGLGLTGLEAAGVAVDLDRDGLGSDARQNGCEALETRSIARVGKATVRGQPMRKIWGWIAPQGEPMRIPCVPIVGSRLRRPPSMIRHTLRHTADLPRACSREGLASGVAGRPIRRERIRASFRTLGATHRDARSAYF